MKWIFLKFSRMFNVIKKPLKSSILVIFIFFKWYGEMSASEKTLGGKPPLPRLEIGMEFKFISLVKVYLGH